jgi:hypothetical protein
VTASNFLGNVYIPLADVDLQADTVYNVGLMPKETSYVSNIQVTPSRFSYSPNQGSMLITGYNPRYAVYDPITYDTWEFVPDGLGRLNIRTNWGNWSGMSNPTPNASNVINFITLQSSLDTTTIPQTNSNVLGYSTNTAIGIMNTSPVNTLDIGSKISMNLITSNVLTVRGNISASYVYCNSAYISEAIKVLNTSNSMIETYTNSGSAMNQRYGIGSNITTQDLILFTGDSDTNRTISFADAKADGTFAEFANIVSSTGTFNSNVVSAKLATVSNLVVSATAGGFTTLIANTINIEQSSMSYKTIKVLTSNGTSLRNINFSNAIDGAQTIINIYPRSLDLDIFANLSNNVGSATRTRVNFLSNIIINSASHAILACYTTDSNTFVSVSEYF